MSTIEQARQALEAAKTMLADMSYTGNLRRLTKGTIAKIDAALASLEGDRRTVRKPRWHLGAMNDGLFIIDSPPRPSNDDTWHDRPDGPALVLNITDLPRGKAQAIVDAHNAALEGGNHAE